MINKVILMGRLTADPDIRQTQNGTAVAKFTVAVNRQYADKQTGERQADFINVNAWRSTAEFIAKYFHKGSMIIVEGSLRNNNYTDQNGVKRYEMFVLADNVTFGESKSAAGGGQPQQATQPQYQNGYSNYQQPPQQAAPPQQMPYNGYQPQYQQPTAPPPQQNVQIGNLSDFEVLSDGDVPF